MTGTTFLLGIPLRYATARAASSTHHAEEFRPSLLQPVRHLPAVIGDPKDRGSAVLGTGCQSPVQKPGKRFRRSRRPHPPSRGEAPRIEPFRAPIQLQERQVYPVGNFSRRLATLPIGEDLSGPKIGPGLLEPLAIPQ